MNVATLDCQTIVGGICASAVTRTTTNKTESRCLAFLPDGSMFAILATPLPNFRFIYQANKNWNGFSRRWQKTMLPPARKIKLSMRFFSFNEKP